MPRTKKTNTSKNQTTTEKASLIPNKLSVLKINRKRALMILVVILILAFAFDNKKYFVAALVNNQPITTLELTKTLHKVYGDRLLNQMINKKILEQETAKRGVIITQQQIDQKIKEVEQQNGGKEVFDSLLSSEGLGRGEFEMQVSIQMLVKGLYEKEASPSAEDVQKFIDENKDAPEATEPAKFRQAAIDSLTQQKLQTLVGEKFQQLKQNSKITIF